MKCVDQVGSLAWKEWHHPNIDIRWNEVSPTLAIHNEDGLAERELTMATRINRAFRKFGAGIGR